MNEFDKKYLQIIKQYNYKKYELIQEGIVDWFKDKAKSVGNTCGNIINIIKSGPSALVKTVTNWFNSSNEKTIIVYSNMAKQLIKLDNNKNIINEQHNNIGWFKSVCNQVSTNYKFITSEEEKKKFINYILNQKKLSKQSWQQLDFSKKKQIYKKFVEKEINITSQSKQIITEGVILLGILVLILLILITIPIVTSYMVKMLNPSDAEKETQKTRDYITKLEQQKKRKEEKIKHDQELEKLTTTQVTNLLKGCTALQ